MSHEYGWTTEYILSRTFKEIEYRLYAIDRRKKIQMSQEILMRGGKPKIAIPKRRVKHSPQDENEISENIEVGDKIKKAFEERQRTWQKS